MKCYTGASKSGSLQEAVSGLSNPQFIIMIVGQKEYFEKTVQELEKKYPGVPSICCVGQSYVKNSVYETGLVVTAFSDGIKAVANVIQHVSLMPMKSIASIEAGIQKIGAEASNTVCIDFCSSNDEYVLATINAALKKKNIPLTGGTAWEGLVACNGVVYPDACVYAFVKNERGKVRVYKENLYTTTQKRHIVTKSDPDHNLLIELDGKKAMDIYMNELNIKVDQIATQTFKNPFGRCIGDDVFIISIKECRKDGSLACFRKLNRMDTLNILEMGNYDEIVRNTVAQIQSDFGRISCVFSINCLFRYLLFQQEGYVDKYLNQMGQLGTHAGLIGLGEHFKERHTNQTMSCVVFE